MTKKFIGLADQGLPRPHYTTQDGKKTRASSSAGGAQEAALECCKARNQAAGRMPACSRRVRSTGPSSMGSGNFQCVAGEKREHARAHSGVEGVAALKTEPSGAENIENSGSQDHSGKLGQAAGREALNGKARNQGQGQIAHNIAPGGTQDSAQAAGKAAEHRHPTAPSRMYTRVAAVPRFQPSR